MSDSRETRPGLSEARGHEILRHEFETAGLEIQEDFPFSEDGISIVLDGFDPKQRVGYEFVTTEAGDRETITPAIIEALERKMDGGGLFVLLVDEFEVMTEEALAFAAARFVEHLRGAGVIS